MEKNQLKWYDAPAVEVVELEAKVSLLAGSDPVSPWDPTDPAPER